MVKTNRQTYGARLTASLERLFRVFRLLRNAVSYSLVFLCLKVLRIYQLTISPLIGSRCRFYPSCSEYAATSLTRHGLIKGCLLTLKRLGKCHPGHPGGVDNVPDNH